MMAALLLSEAWADYQMDRFELNVTTCETPMPIDMTAPYTSFALSVQGMNSSPFFWRSSITHNCAEGSDRGA